MSRMKEFFCVTCRKSQPEVASLKTCSKCKVLQYCSVSCQKKDFRAHKTACVMISAGQERFNEMASALKNYKLPGLPFQNLYETSIGEFSRIATADYMYVSPLMILQSSLGVAQIIWKQVDSRDVYTGISSVLDINLEVLRLDCFDILRVSQLVPFLFIVLGRYQDAYNFLKFWISLPVRDQEQLLKKAKQMKREGQWLHEPNQNILEDVRRTKFYEGFNLETDASLDHLTAILALKLIVIADLKHKAEEAKTFNEIVKQSDPEFSNLGKIKSVSPVLEVISSRIQGYSKVKFTQVMTLQLEQVEFLMKLMAIKNPSILPALVDPEPILSYGAPIDYAFGTPGEAASVLNTSWRIFQRIPGARRALIDFLYPNLDPEGPFPPYPCEVDAPGFVF